MYVHGLGEVQVIWADKGYGRVCVGSVHFLCHCILVATGPWDQESVSLDCAGNTVSIGILGVSSVWGPSRERQGPASGVRADIWDRLLPQERSSEPVQIQG